MDEPHGFGPACQEEAFVFGARRPGYEKKKDDLTSEAVDTWISFMRTRSIKRVVCLLDQQLGCYDALGNGLIVRYQASFGRERVIHAPIEDFHLCDKALLLNRILPFLRSSDEAGERVVVHCSGGSGRTGHVLAAWLVHGREYKPSQAIREVERMNRNPREAIAFGNATEIELMDLLAACARP